MRTEIVAASAEEKMVRISEERTLAAPADDVYRAIADYRQHHPRFLPPAFSDLVVEQGGVGAGTIIAFRLKAGGRVRAHRQRVEEPAPGRLITETDLETGSVTSFTVTSVGSGSHVRIETAWAPHGVRGAIERILAPRVLGPLYRDELERLDRYSSALAAA